jgi:hypothetical protein
MERSPSIVGEWGQDGKSSLRPCLLGISSASARDALGNTVALDLASSRACERASSLVISALFVAPDPAPTCAPVTGPGVAQG